MPTGYTAGILDGSIKNFSQFAKKCMRAFGAASHMRDDESSKPYEPRIPSTYHKECMEEAIKELEIANSITEKDIIEKIKNDRSKNRKYHLGKIKEINENKIKIDSIIKYAETWTPPTDEHQNFKKFMLQQLIDTKKWDCDTKYHDDALKEMEVIDVEKERRSMIESAEYDIEYHTKEYKEEIKRCNEANKWAEDLLKSI